MASQSDSNLFSMRIVSIDYYMAPPIPEVDPCYSTFHGRNVEEVPVIRIYGSTLAGQKTCLHVHRALPYLYVPCFDVSLQSPQDGHAYSQLIARSVEEALKNKTSAGLKRQHVHGCSLVRAQKFYGYHSAEDLFVKIYLYYPREVTRAATLLLEGAVLNRNFQPYESHIPYLLQFLVDYNLYGMGLLHLTKVKFRNPLPDHFIPREARNAGHSRWDIENNSCGFANSEAVSNGETSQDPAIWLSTKVPTGWIWPLPAVGSQDLCIKRQSTCELEGDATVDEIVNQQYKMYTSLSQARPEVKMVQSLIPIWEEEYERTGLHEIVKSPDSSKPLPDMVLRNFCHRLEIEKELVELCTEALNLPCSQTTPVEGEETFVKSVRSVCDVGTLLSSGELIKHTDFDGEPLKVLKEEDNDGCRLSQASFIDDNGTPKHMPAFRSIEEQNLSYEETEASEPKVVDREALGLLRWLASSQALDNLCTDEDLVNEAVLSPLLPTTTIEEILDKAHLDYDIESQQECLDILDSVEAASDYLDNRLSEHVIPQVDGASDDQFKSPLRSGKPSKSEMNKPSKGSLPISTKRKVQVDSVHSCNNSPIEMDNGSDSSAFTKTKVDKSHVGLAVNENVDFSHPYKGNTLIGCSVRDLMRRKRAHRVEPSESGSHSIKKLVLGKEEFAAACSTGLGSVGSDANSDDCSPKYGKLPFSSFTTSNDRESIGATGGSENSAFSESEVQEYFISGHEESKSMTCMDPYECCNRREAFAVSSSKPAPSYIQRRKPDLLSSGRLLKFDKDENQLAGKGSETRDLEITVETNGDYNSKKLEQHIKTCSSKAVRTLWDGDDTRFIEMTLNRKPPAIDWRQWTSKDPLPVPACDNDLIMKLETFEWTSKICSEGREADDIPLFFDSNCLEGNQYSHNSAIERGNANVHQETALGVATHYQNDGSLLYLLTPALSPPSNDLVSQWVLQKTIQRSAESSPGAQEESLQPVLMEPSSPKYDEVLLENHKIRSTSSIDMDSHVCDVSLPSCRASPYVEPLGRQSCKEKNRSREMEVNQCHTKRVGTEPQIEKIHVKEKEGTQSWQEISQMSGPDCNSKLTPFSQTGFRDPAIVGARQQLTLMSIEVVAESRGDLQPDPRYDAVNVIALVIQEDSIPISDICVLVRAIDGEQSHRNVDGLCGCKVVTVSEEKHLFDQFLKIISSFDPDVLMGWEVQGGSLGFLAERAAHLGIRLLKVIARTPIVETKHPASDSANFETGMIDSPLPEALLADSVVLDEAIIGDEWGRIHASGLHVGGRIVLNIWRIIRWELNLHMYTIEAVAEAVLRKKVPSIPSRTLSVWFSSGHGRARFRCIEYVVERAKLSFEIINQLDLVNRTAELARVYGIDFFSVLSRGSQYRVESMYLRLAHTQNYLSISPGPQQVSSQPAMECLPLVMEPESGFYVDPVVVLDFQSLYPSMIIAYNLCFSTCLGNALPSKSNRLGVSSYKAKPQHLMHLKDQILLTPNGVMYVPPQVRKGVLPRLLEEILSTRIMVKQAMKKLSPQQLVLRRIFNARQLALKLIANVTYGYAAAGFSGRMPCAELADSIVQCGRRTLETAISFVNSHDKWNAKVIYGDTDSMFVLLKGRTVEEAFCIGQEIASSITSINPNPVTLKMDKVYYPCVLLTKKRYVGYSYESVDQVKPIFDAKGIETVRRDACPIVAKTLEQSLKLLFETRNISNVKEYLQRQWTKILCGKVSFQDFVFLKEVHLGRYRASSLPPAALVASKAMRADPRAEPRYGERVAYIVIHGEPGARLADMVVDPLELLDINSSYRLNDLYYINKQIIPALQRVFGLLGADLKQWLTEMPRPVRPTFAKRYFTRSHLGSRCDSGDNRQRTSRKLQGNRTRVDYYYLSKHCILCDELVQDSTYLCERCAKSGPVVATALVGKTSKLEREIHHLAAICRHCGGGDWIVESGVKCESLACSVLYERRKVQKELQAISSVATEAGFYPRCMVEWF